jgi:hypothetical protein
MTSNLKHSVILAGRGWCRATAFCCSVMLSRAVCASAFLFRFTSIGGDLQCTGSLVEPCGRVPGLLHGRRPAQAQPTETAAAAAARELLARAGLESPPSEFCERLPVFPMPQLMIYFQAKPAWFPKLQNAKLIFFWRSNAKLITHLEYSIIKLHLRLTITYTLCTRFM